MSEPAKNPLKLFYCYAHEDKALRDTLDKHLSVLKRQQLIEVWYDGKIDIDAEREYEMGKHLGSADIVLLLVSAAFIASDYCYSKEMERALQRHEEGMALVVPVILRPVYWQDAPFSQLQVLPTEAKPVTRWINPDDAYEDIARSIRGVVTELRVRREAKAKEWFQKGVALGGMMQYAEAIEAFDEALRFNPNDASAYYYKGGTLNDLKRYKEAVVAFDEALRLTPNDDASVYHNKGIALKELKRYEEAIVAFDQAIRFNPNDAEAYKDKGVVLGELKRYEEAIAAFRKAQQLDQH